MSRTNRSGKKRRAADYYPTPSWVTRAILTEALAVARDGVIVEPSAGDGAILRDLIEFGVSPLFLRAVELDPKRAANCQALGVPTECCNFLTWRPPSRPALIIGNPPFSLALEFVEHALTIGCPVAFLLRVGFLEPPKKQKRRARLMAVVEGDTPVAARIIPRPSFTGGSTDMAAYAWLLWRFPGGDRLKILAPHADKAGPGQMRMFPGLI